MYLCASPMTPDSCVRDSVCSCQRSTRATVKSLFPSLLPRPPPLPPPCCPHGSAARVSASVINHPKRSVLAGGGMGRTFMSGFLAAGTRLAAMGGGNLRESWCPPPPGAVSLSSQGSDVGSLLHPAPTGDRAPCLWDLSSQDLKELCHLATSAVKPVLWKEKASPRKERYWVRVSKRASQALLGDCA